MPFAELLGSLGAAERWLLPGACLVCGEASGDRDPLVCDQCRSQWRKVPAPWCERCGQPMGGLDGQCRVCLGWPDRLVRVRSAVWLTEGARLVVHQLKYGGWSRLAETMAHLMRRLEPVAPGVTLVPIPVGPRRRRERGYNQAEVLARAIAAVVGATVAPDLLRRVRERPTQTLLSPAARRANIAGAFQASRPASGTVVLVDDVFTTGATLVAAAAALEEAGATRIEAVTFARARPPLD